MRHDDEFEYAALPGDCVDPSIDISKHPYAPQESDLVSATVIAARSDGWLFEHSELELKLAQARRFKYLIQQRACAVLDELIPACMRDDARVAILREQAASKSNMGIEETLFYKRSCGVKPATIHLDFALSRLCSEIAIAHQHNKDTDLLIQTTRQKVEAMNEAGGDGTQIVRTWTGKNADYLFNFLPIARQFDALRRLQSDALSTREVNHYFSVYLQANHSEHEVTDGKLAMGFSQLKAYATRIVERFDVLTSSELLSIQVCHERVRAALSPITACVDIMPLSTK